MILSRQYDSVDCGPTCIKMIANHFGKKYPMQFLRELTFISKDGVSLFGISHALEHIGFKVWGNKLTLEELRESFKGPCILHWNQNHFVILEKISKSFFSDEYVYHIADPGHGLIKVSEDNFTTSWLSENMEGVGLFMEPTDAFYAKQPPKGDILEIRFLLKYLVPHKKQLALLFLFLLLGSGLTLILPFLTEALIDRGVNTKNLNFVSIILLAQLGVFMGTMVIDIFRNWLMLYIGTHISIHIISDFFKKMLRLPISFFDSKSIGDFRQRIQDNDRIEQFLTSQSLITLFSIITFSVFFAVLWYYSIKILLIYLTLTLLAITWSFHWLKKRKILDYHQFQRKSENQESIYEMLNGITEMKLNQFEDFKRHEWEVLQKKIFKINIRILKIDQIQLSGFEFINQLKNIIVTFIAAIYVVDDRMTLGALLSISYIIGQMNSPVDQLVGFFRSLQDAKLSLGRLNEVQKQDAEEVIDPIPKQHSAFNHFSNDCITIDKVSFQYEGPKSPYILDDIRAIIPKGKVTAIVGPSGSGKTTLIKLLLRFYEPTMGNIYYGGKNAKNLSPRTIRENCGVVMQDGYIFSETIERNIAMGDMSIDRKRLEEAYELANLKGFIDSLPMGGKTKIGATGSGLSGGQKQRILIARAVYKNPHYIFLDEATSSLDAENEKIIHKNLQHFFTNKTVVIIAHRLSTVKNANNIIVIKDGKIVEQGNHSFLVDKKSNYYNLIKNQLELGN